MAKQSQDQHQKLSSLSVVVQDTTAAASSGSNNKTPAGSSSNSNVKRADQQQASSSPQQPTKPQPPKIILPDGWIVCFSKREKRHYYFNAQSNKSVWVPPPGSIVPPTPTTSQQQQQQQQQPQQHSMMTQQHLGAQSPSLAPQPCPAVPQQVRFSNCSSPPPSMGGQPSYAGGGPPEQPVLQTVSHQLAAPANTTSQNFQSPIQHRTQPQLMYQQTSDHKQSQPQHLLSAAIGQHTNRSLGQLHHTVGTGGQHLPLMTNGRGPPPPPPPPQPSLLPQASCVFFQNKGWCKNGTGCQFAHNKVEPLTTQPPQQVWLQPQVVMMTNNSSNHHQQHQHFGS
uniref:C3H1-type domain-containing protein n=1 Tax=Heterosigma akashiwo TaxID=2829 RepID=A0A7S4D776_HETAK